MPVLQSISLLFWAVIIPVCMGAGIATFVDKQAKNLCFMWITGYLLFLALFQVVAVPFILLQNKISFQNMGAFSALVLVFGLVSAVAAAGGAVVWCFKGRKKVILKAVSRNKGKADKIFWAVFGVLLLVQLVLAAVLAFADGDDAYYVAVSTLAESSDTMYMVLPYTGGTTGLDTRHGLAPFPILISFFARMSGIHPATVAHIFMPILFIPLTYSVYGMIGSCLLKSKKQALPVFMILVEILIMWGNYSLYTAETFLMTRSRQGKAALGNVIIPALFLLLYLIGERLAENRKVEKSLWVLVVALMTASCLCSTLGGFLAAVLLGAFGLCVLFSYRKWKILIPLCISLIPAMVYIGLYIVME